MRLVVLTGVFSPAEIAIARELAEDNLAKGAVASGYHFLIADGPAGIEGYAAFGPIPGTDAGYELYWIAVHPAARRSGLGHRLQAAAEEAARSFGAAFMKAETSTVPDYAAARNFYTSQGYSLVLEVPDWHRPGDGMAMFYKRL